MSGWVKVGERMKKGTEENISRNFYRNDQLLILNTRPSECKVIPLPTELRTLGINVFAVVSKKTELFVLNVD